VAKTRRRNTDQQAIQDSASDYYESWMAGHGERMRACLHPLLAKRGWLEDEAGAPELDLDTADSMATLAAAGRGMNMAPGYTIDVLDQDGGIACAKMTCAPYVEYLNLIAPLVAGRA